MFTDCEIENFDHLSLVLFTGKSNILIDSFMAEWCWKVFQISLDSGINFWHFHCKNKYLFAKLLEKCKDDGTSHLLFYIDYSLFHLNVLEKYSCGVNKTDVYLYLVYQKIKNS